MKEIQDIEKDTLSQTSVQMVAPSDLMHLKGTFRGPPDTPYAGGKFTVDIHISSDYPFRAPKMKFDTKVYHPNISSQTGAICLDILKDQWSPILTIKSALISVQSLLECPEPSDPQDAEVAKHFLSDREGFNNTARYWTETYAEGVAGANINTSNSITSSSGVVSSKEPDPIDLYGLDRDSVANLMGMGFSKARVVEVMRRVGVKSMSNEANVDIIMAELLR